MLRGHCARLLPAAGALLALVVLLAGCGSSSDPVTSRSPEAILTAAQNAAREAAGVRVSAVFYAGRHRPHAHLRPASTIELQLTGDGGHARVTLLASSTETVRTGRTLYARSGRGFYEQLARETGAHLKPGTWVKGPATSAQFSGLLALTEPSGELMLLLRKPTLSLTKGKLTTIDGQRAIELKTRGKLYTGAIYIAATGTPYPLEIVRHGRESATVTFTAWNRQAPLSAPAGAVDLTGLQGHKNGT